MCCDSLHSLAETELLSHAIHNSVYRSNEYLGCLCIESEVTNKWDQQGRNIDDD